MYENDIGIVLFRNYGSWPNLKTKEILPKVISTCKIAKYFVSIVMTF